jgi:hypothetical protein
MDQSKAHVEQLEAGASTPSIARDDILVQMDGHDYHEIIPKPSKDPNDPLVIHNHKQPNHFFEVLTQ